MTGGHGFLGSAVVRQFQENGDTVSAPRSAEFDLRTLEGIDGALAQARPDVVVHLAAAVGGIGANERHPGRFFYENALMGLNLMERSRLAGVAKFVVAGTACEYPDNAPLPLREEEIWDGYPAPVTAPYGLAKRMLLVQSQAYRAEYGFDGIHLIPANLYGPGDNFDLETSHVVPALIRRFTAAVRNDSRSVRCWGSGTATREFLYVEDAARGIVLATEHYNDPAPVNLGSGVETPVRWLAEEIARLTGFEGWIDWDSSRPDGTPRRRLDVSKAEEEFGFRAEIDLHEGLRRTISWYQA